MKVVADKPFLVGDAGVMARMLLTVEREGRTVCCTNFRVKYTIYGTGVVLLNTCTIAESGLHPLECLK